MLVEGQSEENFVKQTLAPWLAGHRVYCKPIVLWTKRLPSGGGHRGGVSSWRKICKSLNPLLGDSNAWVTTLIDFYGLPEDVPGYTEASSLGKPHDKVLALQNCWSDAIKHPRFLPFLALHELEAWLFCAPEVVAAHFELLSLAEKIHQAVTEAGGPELINHGTTTHPKARLNALAARYKETSDGPILLQKIGIPAIRASCPHFSTWLTRLEALGSIEPEHPS
ncbi:MAG: DUF4276 family protein [Rhodoferax sp.]|nr:DUF4276 family protein [Rhodoferax sp.]